MKGLIALAKKNESISDKIVRLYKEGYSIPEIAKEMEMPKDNVPRILEKHFPDYASFEQPVREGADENGNGKKSVFNMSVSELFGKKNKKQENVELWTMTDWLITVLRLSLQCFRKAEA